MNPVARERVVQFVRETLGCGCPPEVFERIEGDRFLNELTGLPVSRTLTIGGRLLVIVCSSAVDDASLADLLARGLRIRKAHGLNRVRCVVPRSAWPTEGAVDPPDDRLHVHIVDDARIPA